MLTYNKDKSLYGDIGIEENEAVMTDLINKIKEEGFNGYKGYFYAIYKEKIDPKKAKPAGGKRKEEIAKKDKLEKLELLVNTSTMLPLEEW